MRFPYHNRKLSRIRSAWSMPCWSETLPDREDVLRNTKAELSDLVMYLLPVGYIISACAIANDGCEHERKLFP